MSEQPGNLRVRPSRAPRLAPVGSTLGAWIRRPARCALLRIDEPEVSSAAAVPDPGGDDRAAADTPSEPGPVAGPPGGQPAITHKREFAYRCPACRGQNSRAVPAQLSHEEFSGPDRCIHCRRLLMITNGQPRIVRDGDLHG